MSDHGKSISVIVPVLNESTAIQSFLQHLREQASGAEIIVVDGGSSDGTPGLASGRCDHLIQSKPGRAAQMNAGARAASRDIFWFLHADVTVPPHSMAAITRALEDPGVAGGYFRIRLPEARAIYRLTDSFAHYAGLLLRMRCGDHGLFCRRRDFFDLGGFPNVPLMEDVDFYRMLLRRGRVIAVTERMRASVRRYQAVGPARLTFAYGLLATLYLLKVPRPVLATIYKKLCSPNQSRP